MCMSVEGMDILYAGVHRGQMSDPPDAGGNIGAGNQTGVLGKGSKCS